MIRPDLSPADVPYLYYHTDVLCRILPDRLIGRTTGFGPVNLGSSPSPAAV